MGRLTPPGAGDSTPAVSILVMKERADFLKAARANRASAGSFYLQARKRAADETCPQTAIRIGFTCSKKVGNAVARNRAKRRLREIARTLLPTHGRAGWDYVLIGSAGRTAERAYNDLLADLIRTLPRVHSRKKPENDKAVYKAVSKPVCKPPKMDKNG